MSSLPKNNFYIRSTEELRDFLGKLPAQPGMQCAVDTEADSLHSYREKLCLIQFSAGEFHAIIDPLEIADLTPFVERLMDMDIWMHGADFDMTMLKRTFDHIPPRVFDTQTAARLCGARQFGLAHLVESTYGVVLSKQSQRANWGRRPLSEKMVEYALNDVRYILPLAEHFSGKLKELNREEWFLESCVDARDTVSNRPAPDADNQWRIPGSGNLRGHGMAYLRALWHWRDKEAERMDRPAFKIIGNAELLEFAQALHAGQEARLPGRFPPAVVRRFQKAVKDASELPADQWPKRRFGRRDARPAESEKRFEELKLKRDQVAVELDLDPALVASRAAMEAISIDPAAAGEQLLNWQLQLLGLTADNAKRE